MDEISNIQNFDINENHPVLDSVKVNENNILNKSAEQSVVGSVAFLQSSLSVEKQTLTSFDNNSKTEKPNSSLTVLSDSNGFAIIKSEENINFFSEDSIGMVESANSSTLINETSTSIKTDCNTSNKSAQNDSGRENDSCLRSNYPYLDITPAGSVDIPQDTLSDEKQNSLTDTIGDELLKQENIDFKSTCIPNSKLEKIDLCVTSTPDLVDFSFREQITDELLESFTETDSLQSQSNGSVKETCEINSAVSFEENRPVNTSVELLGNDSVPKSPTSGSIVPNDSIICNSLLQVNPEKEDSCAIGNTSSELEILKNKNEVSKVDSCGFNALNENNDINIICNSLLQVNSEKEDRCAIANTSSELEILKNKDEVSKVENKDVNSVKDAIQVSKNASIDEPADISPLEEHILFGKDKISIVDPCILNTSNENKNVNIDEAAIQVSENTSFKGLAEISPSKEHVLFDTPDKPLENIDISTDNECKVDSDKAADLQMHESTYNNAASPFKVERISFGMSDTPEEFADPDFAFKIPEGESTISPEQFSDLNSAFKLPEVPSDNPLVKMSDPNFSVKVPSDNPFEKYSNINSTFKLTEVPSDNPLDKFPDADFAFKVPEIPSFKNSVFSPKAENSLAKEDDEQFVDAAQFFKDADSIQFLENIRTSTVQSGSPIARSSLYVNFDPLHLKFQNNSKQDNCALTAGKNIPAENRNSDVLRKHLDAAARESLGNILISFDSPKSHPNVDSKMPVDTPPPTKMLTEEEHQQKLKIHELETQEAYLMKQKEMEMQIAKRDELLKIQLIVIEELSGVSRKLFEEIRKDGEKITSLEEENKKLKDDLKTSSEDLQSVENTFTDFYKRYEQCKGMLKSFKDNEEHLKQKILDLQAEAKEQEHLYSLLKERTEEIVEKANMEMDSVKRSGEAQLTVLKAQLKKAEMKISSLESDNKQIKIENSQLGGICDDLMAKVSRS